MPFKTLLTLFLIMVSSLTPLSATEMCSYQTYQWNSKLKKVMNFKHVRHPYSELKPVEIDRKTGCTVCQEDQQIIRLNDHLSLTICRKIADRVIPTLQQLLKQGEIIESIKGYRVGMTKGSLNAEGNRTQFSNHSFGIAVDINTEHNGLYDRCLSFNKSCRLIKGGHWDPAQLESLTKESTIVKSMLSLGFKWGGEIAGKQKDFMHFSPSGY